MANGIIQAVEHMPERTVFRVLFGIDDATEGSTLTSRRQAAAELVEVTPESFRVRREGRFVDELAHALLIELSPSRSGKSSSHSENSDRQITRVLLLYGHVNKREATTLRERLTQEVDIQVTSVAVDLQPYASSRHLMDFVREHDAVIHVISVPFLKSQQCMRELLPLMKNDTERNHYRQRTVPLLIEDPKLDLFDARGQLSLVDYWMEETAELEEQINSRDTAFATALEELRGDLTVRRDIAEHIMRFVRATTENIYTASYGKQEKLGFSGVISQIREIEAESTQPLEVAQQVASRYRATLLPPTKGLRELNSETLLQQNSVDEPSAEEKQLLDLYDSIVIASESDPDHPEFPPFSPRFPATPVHSIYVPQLDRDVLIKDESHNFTGSHKDRMAWEIVVYYKSIIQDLLSPHAKSLDLPAPSIISNGSSALAIQVMLRCFDLPTLKVLIDQRTNRRIIQKLINVGCEVFIHDLSERELDSADVLELTENRGGFDVTARSLVDPTRRAYYDWLAYEILNCDATHIFIPVGTGDLYVNILTVLRDELMGVTNDRRLLGGSETIENLQLYGATSFDWKTKMDRLYAPHRPTLAEAKRVVSGMRDQGLCGAASEIYNVNESVVVDALTLARGNGIRCDESGIAGLSLLLQLSAEDDFPTDSRLLVVNTGWLPL